MNEKKQHEREKCIFCTYLQAGRYKHRLAMVRLYVKVKGKWVPVGWVCPYCGYSDVDEEKFPLKTYSTVKSRIR